MSNELETIADLAEDIKIEIKSVADKIDELDDRLSNILKTQCKKEVRQMLQDSPSARLAAEYK